MGDVAITLKQFDIVLHASGLKDSKEQYRDYYCTEPDDADLLALVNAGLMEGPSTPKALGGMAYFYLTPTGIDTAWKLSGKKRPKPKRTAARSRDE